MKKISVRATAAAVLVCSAVTGTAVYFVTQPSGTEKQIYDVIHEAQTLVDNKFVGEYDTDNLIDYTLAGYTAGLGDRWTTYMDADSYQAYQQKTAESTVGIGVTVSYQEPENADPYLYIEQVAYGSPAEEAGISVYESIVAVNGKSIKELGGYDEAVDEVRGDENTDVTLTIRNADGDTKDYTVTRKQYDQVSVHGKIIDGNIGYIVIERFIADTDTRLKDTIAQLQEQGAEKLIFDLRNNPGGQLTTLVGSLDPLLPEGIIISLTDKQGKSETYTSDAEELDLPMSVLVNADSYSAAEFFAADLQYYGKAKVIGEKTCGKGYSQVSYELSNGGAFTLSVDCYYMPDGESLIDKGVTPDVEVSLSEEKAARFYALTEEEDDQLQAAIAALD